MKSSMILVSLVVGMLLPACSGAMVAPPPEPTPTEIAVSTLPPPTATSASQALIDIGQNADTISSASPTEMVEELPPTDTPTPEPSATPTPEPDWLNTFGRTEDNLMYLGNPDAPVTLIDFSDFM